MFLPLSESTLPSPLSRRKGARRAVCSGPQPARWVPGPRLGKAPEDQQRAQLQFIFIFCLYINAFST